MTKVIIADVGKNICPECKKAVVPNVYKSNVYKYGYSAGVTQKICPLCGNKIVRPKAAGFCFIATAAYGSELDTRVQILCDFRDRYLSKKLPGRIFIKFYYSISPPIAQFLARFEFLKAIVRLYLTPIIYIVEKKMNRSDG